MKKDLKLSDRVYECTECGQVERGIIEKVIYTFYVAVIDVT